MKLDNLIFSMKFNLTQDEIVTILVSIDCYRADGRDAYSVY